MKWDCLAEWSKRKFILKIYDYHKSIRPQVVKDIISMSSV